MKGDEDLERRLIGSGLGEEPARAALALEGIAQRWRRRAAKRLPERRAIDVLALDLDVQRLDVLTATLDPGGEFAGAAEQETTVGAIAARLGIDASRASRLVAELIASGYAKRAVSQRDARRTIVELTEAGRAAATEVRVMKIAMLGAFLSEWSSGEIATFVPLLERFSAWSDRDPSLAPPTAADQKQ